MRPSSYSCCFEIIPDAASPSTGSSISLAVRLLLTGHRKQHRRQRRARALNGLALDSFILDSFILDSFILDSFNRERIIVIFLVGLVLSEGAKIRT